MGRDDPRYLVVGHLNKPHGTKGELFVWPLTDHPEGVFASGVVLRQAHGDGSSPDPDPELPSLRVAHARPFRRGFLVAFDGVRDRAQAELLRGRYLLREIEALEALAEGEVFYHQLLDSEVVTTGGEVVGRVTEVYELRPADMLLVVGERGEAMVPFLESIIVEVDVDAGRIVIDPPDGLLDLRSP